MGTRELVLLLRRLGTKIKLSSQTCRPIPSLYSRAFLHLLLSCTDNLATQLTSCLCRTNFTVLYFPVTSAWDRIPLLENQTLTKAAAMSTVGTDLPVLRYITLTGWRKHRLFPRGLGEPRNSFEGSALAAFALPRTWLVFLAQLLLWYREKTRSECTWQPHLPNPGFSQKPATHPAVVDWI